MFPRCETYRLYERGGAGICCDVDGVILGPVKLVERSDNSYFVRPVEDIIDVLEMAYGPLQAVAAEELALKIVGIAHSLNRGEMAIAQLKTLYLRLPEIAPENFVKMGWVVMGKANSERVVDMTAAENAVAHTAGRQLEQALGKAVMLGLAKNWVKENRAVVKGGGNLCHDPVNGQFCSDGTSYRRASDKDVLDDKGNVLYRKAANVDIVPGQEEKIKAITKEFKDKTKVSLIVNSGVRGPKEQAEAMYVKLKAGETGGYGQEKSYKEIKDAYDNGLKYELSEKEIQQKMTDVITRQVSDGIYISNHMTENAADLRVVGLNVEQKKEVIAAAKKQGYEARYESTPPHVHVDFTKNPAAKKPTK